MRPGEITPGIGMKHSRSAADRKSDILKRSDAVTELRKEKLQPGF
ncbi:hypothetical protein FRUB_07712 [Fimbriiglobus ruber]|uniref:Uncharacterized protein n=1 Tax=Fimbriiglobus ruber TaxID=1908690 RepID=A0A225DAV4_9BACT|nr:hypothetical protein FRUB_07712 [Fimbriiglobus ruber]